MNCLNDLRRNLSGNVHPSCHIGGLNEAYDTSCCPQYIVKRKRTILKYETSAYPSALSCLRNVGCETSHVRNLFYFNLSFSLFFLFYLLIFL